MLVIVIVLFQMELSTCDIIFDEYISRQHTTSLSVLSSAFSFCGQGEALWNGPLWTWSLRQRPAHGLAMPVTWALVP